ncbi:MAG: hypothetical protein ACYC54_04670 [Sedimentisphaerales bacterium]
MRQVRWVLEFWDVDVRDRCFSSKEVAIAFGRAAVSAQFDGRDGFKLPPEEVGVVRCTRKYIKTELDPEKDDQIRKAVGDCYILYSDLDFGSGVAIIFPVRDEEVINSFCCCDNLECRRDSKHKVESYICSYNEASDPIY